MGEQTLFIGVNSIKFNQRVKDDNDYMVYLSNIKWKVDINA
jgi:hypothetical protein